MRARRRPRLWLALALLGGLVAGVIALALERGPAGEDPAARPASPSRVEPVPDAPTPEGQARNLADWIRRYSR